MGIKFRPNIRHLEEQTYTESLESLKPFFEDVLLYTNGITLTAINLNKTPDWKLIHIYANPINRIFLCGIGLYTSIRIKKIQLYTSNYFYILKDTDPRVPRVLAFGWPIGAVINRPTSTMQTFTIDINGITSSTGAPILNVEQAELIHDYNLCLNKFEITNNI